MDFSPVQEFGESECFGAVAAGQFLLAVGEEVAVQLGPVLQEGCWELNPKLFQHGIN